MNARTGAPSTRLLRLLIVAIALSIATLGVALVSRPALAPGPPGPVHGPTLPIPMPTTARLSAPSSNVVWAYVADSVLFRSTDRGVTWERRPVPEPIGQGRSEVSFVDPNNGWYSTGGSPETQCNGAGTVIWRTKDAGATWEQVALGPSAGIGYLQCKDGLSFVDPMHGFLAAWDDNHPPSMYRTSDGGTTWSAATLPDPPGFTTLAGGDTMRAGLVRAFGSKLLVPAWGMQPGAHAETEYAFSSIDGGASWTYLATTRSGINNVTFVSGHAGST